MNSFANMESLFNSTSYIEAMNVLAFQNLQTYLKLLLLSMNATQKQFKPIGGETEDSNTVSSPTWLHETKTQNSSSPANPKSKSKNRKSSEHLWHLMSKEFSSNKFKSTEEPRESCDEDETYRKLNRFYVPVLRTKAPLLKRKNTCGHPEREYHARGKCGCCYHKSGRDKKPWNCEHDKLYALGLCIKCYAVRNRQLKKACVRDNVLVPKENTDSCVNNIKEENFAEVQEGKVTQTSQKDLQFVIKSEH